MKKKTKFILVSTFIILLALMVFFIMMLGPVTKLVDLSKLNDADPLIARNEIYRKWNKSELTNLPYWTGKADTPFEIDLRSCNLTMFDLRGEFEMLSHSVFDTDTKWPEWMPTDFDPQKVLELGKNPGLGIRKLHDMGITGKGVSIAIIDQALLLDHEQYRDNIELYELLHTQDKSVQMHGTAVTSIAVGRSTGVAPDAKVYYIASTFGLFTPWGYYPNLEWMAKGIYRVLEINKALLEDEKIRVISISKGFDKLGIYEKGGDKVYEAIEAANKAGVFVITTSTFENYGFTLAGLGRELYSDPDSIDSYTPGLFWADSFYNDSNWALQQNILLVPMDTRSYASFTGASDYAFSRIGGLSWTCPWLAGMYALCAQVNPNMEPGEFIDIAFMTGDDIKYRSNNTEYTLGTIINPLNIIERLGN